MCKYCEQRKVVKFSEGLIKQMTLGINDPLFYKRPKYIGEDPFGRPRTIESGIVGIDLMDGKYVLTDGWGYIEINHCPVCGRRLKDV